MSNDKTESVLRKVRALLAQAEDASVTPEEAEAFSAKAEELIARYAIDAALIAHREGTTEKPEVRQFPVEGAYPLPKATLWHVIASANRCKVIRSGKGKRMQITVVGYPSDLDATELLFTSLILQGTNAMLHAARSHGWMQAAEAVSFRTSFLYSFASHVGRRLDEIARRTTGEAEQQQAGTALVLRDRKQDVDAAFADLFPHTRTSKVGSIGNSAGYHAGRDAANRADLGGSKLGGTRRALPA